MISELAIFANINLIPTFMLLYASNILSLIVVYFTKTTSRQMYKVPISETSLSIKSDKIMYSKLLNPNIKEAICYYEDNLFQHHHFHISDNLISSLKYIKKQTSRSS